MVDIRSKLEEIPFFQKYGIHENGAPWGHKNLISASLSPGEQLHWIWNWNSLEVLLRYCVHKNGADGWWKWGFWMFCHCVFLVVTIEAVDFSAYSSITTTVVLWRTTVASAAVNTRQLTLHQIHMYCTYMIIQWGCLPCQNASERHYCSLTDPVTLSKDCSCCCCCYFAAFSSSGRNVELYVHLCVCMWKIADSQPGVSEWRNGSFNMKQSLHRLCY